MLDAHLNITPGLPCNHIQVWATLLQSPLHLQSPAACYQRAWCIPMHALPGHAVPGSSLALQQGTQLVIGAVQKQALDGLPWRCSWPGQASGGRRGWRWGSMAPAGWGRWCRCRSTSPPTPCPQLHITLPLSTATRCLTREYCVVTGGKSCASLPITLRFQIRQVEGTQCQDCW